MKYNINFSVVDNNYEQVFYKILNKELNNELTVGDIKLLCNDGKYTNIKQEIFYSNSTSKNPTNDKVVTSEFVTYRIVMN